MGRGAGLVTALAGVWLAGAAYLPVDPGYPAARIAFMLRRRGPGRGRGGRGRAAGAGGAPRGPGGGGGRAGGPVRPGAGPGGPAGRAGRPRRVRRRRAAGPGNAAYVMYTSGSTGAPKGVTVTHGGVVNLLGWAGGVRAGAGAVRVLAATSASFDVSVFEMFGRAGGGAVLVAAGRRGAAGRAGAGARSRRSLPGHPLPRAAGGARRRPPRGSRGRGRRWCWRGRRWPRGWRGGGCRARGW